MFWFATYKKVLIHGSCNKASWACGVQAEGEDFKGTYSPRYGGRCPQCWQVSINQFHPSNCAIPLSWWDVLMCFPFIYFIVVQSAIGRQLVSGSDNFRFILVQQKAKRATVGPLPGVTQDIAGFKVNDLLSFFSCFWSYILFMPFLIFFVLIGQSLYLLFFVLFFLFTFT